MEPNSCHCSPAAKGETDRPELTLVPFVGVTDASRPTQEIVGMMPLPPAPVENPNRPVNINYVYGLSDEKPQQWMPPLVYLGLLMVGLPICVYLPTHLVHVVEGVGERETAPCPF